MGHGLMENRSGLLVDACLSLAGGHAERIAALHMIEPHADRPRAITLGADKGEPVLGLASGQTRGTLRTSSTSCAR